jgi:GTP-binding protein Era
MKKCGYVALIGQPNSGKSTLMNSLLNFNLSIVNPKVQTTRNKILGILSEDDYQVIFIDTPGIFEPKSELQKFMFEEMKISFKEADIILHLIDGSKFSYNGEKRFLEIFKNDLTGRKIIVALNKIDIIEQSKTENLMESLKTEFGYNTVVPVSALINFNLDSLKNIIIENLPSSDFFFDNETLTDKPEKFFVAEIIRDKVLELYQDEIPYSVFIDIREFKVRESGKDYINADIILERNSQKKILIGKGGEMIKSLGKKARAEIEKFLDREVYLNLFVRIRKDWRKDKKFLKDNF